MNDRSQMTEVREQKTERGKRLSGNQEISEQVIRNQGIRKKIGDGGRIIENSKYDLKRHVNYIHFNPVKHGLVRCPHRAGRTRALNGGSKRAITDMTGFAIAMDKGPLYQSPCKRGICSGNKQNIGVRCTPYQIAPAVEDDRHTASFFKDALDIGRVL